MHRWIGFLPCGLLWLAACAPAPLLHPMRVIPGPQAEIAMGGGSYSGDDPNRLTPEEQAACDDNMEDARCGPGGFNFTLLPAVSFSHGWLLRDHIGVLTGVYGLAWQNQTLSWKKPKNLLLGALALHSLVTVQNTYVSVGVGPEIGGGGIAIMGGVELRLAPARAWALSATAYGRRFWPYSTDYDPETAISNSRSATRELGARLGIGVVYVQYSFLKRDEGIWSYVLPDAAGTSFSMISIGVSINATLFTRRSQTGSRE